MKQQQLVGKALLLVDDDENFCHILARILSRSGFKIETANNHQQAKEKTDLALFNYAIVDLKIADESGLDLIAKLLNSNAEMRIIILTGYASITTAVEAIKLGAIQYLTKPAETQDIISALIEDSSSKPQQSIPDNPMSVKRLEWEHVQKVLAENNGNISSTAKALGMHRRTLQRKLQKRPVKH